MTPTGIAAPVAPAPVSHTPGPWQITGGAIEGLGSVVGICSADGVHVTDVRGYGLSLQADIANGRLIAAAPEMLAALCGFLSHDSALKPEYRSSPSLKRQVQAAVAKAQGL